jgi:amidophosphoribosyltransferase
MMKWDKLGEECGVVGIYTNDALHIAPMTCYGLIALQHRGQESAGIAVKNDNGIKYYKDMGLVQEVFSSETLSKLTGTASVGHVRYSTTGDSNVANAQPLVVKYRGGSIALAHNGNLVNAGDIRNRMEDDGAIFQTSIDSEVIAALIARSYRLGLKEGLISALEQLRGSFALTVLFEDKLIGVRDANGLRPLSLGRLPDGGYVLASETCALDVLNADFVRDIEPGEVVMIDENGIESFRFAPAGRRAVCAFEYVYFARPDSNIDGVNVYMSRRNAGRILAEEHPVEADLVIGVPDSGNSGAIGYSEASGIPLGIGLIKNKYLGRTFIQPDQKMRELSVSLKLNALKENIAGKRLVMIDDSIVRGTTSKRIVEMLRKAGAREIHMRITSPPVAYPCYYGIDTPSRQQLVGAQLSVEEIGKRIGVDSLGYLSIEGLQSAIGLKATPLLSEMPLDADGRGISLEGLSDAGICQACFDGDYPTDVPLEANKFQFEKQ